MSDPQKPQALPAIPDDAGLDAMSDQQIQDLAGARGLNLETPDRSLALAALRQVRHDDDSQPVVDPITTEGAALAEANKAPAPAVGAHPEHDDRDYDPTNPREFDPTVVLLHLERDGVVVEGFINPFTGEGTDDLLIQLQDKLVQARSREDGAAPAAETASGLEQPDPNALKRQRAAAAGHTIDPDTKRCTRCHAAEWACLDGVACNPRADDFEAPAPVEASAA